MINEQNIEAWLLDHLEGSLSAEQETMLEKFLQAHPEWRPDEGELPTVSAAASHMPDKDSLRRNFPPVGKVDRHRLDDLLVAKLEGDLTTEQEAEVNTFVAADREAMKAWQLMQLTIATSTEQYPNKESLKKHGKVIMLWPRLASAAAIAVLFGLGVWSLMDRPEVDQQIAEEVQEEDRGTDVKKSATRNEMKHDLSAGRSVTVEEGVNKGSDETLLQRSATDPNEGAAAPANEKELFASTGNIKRIKVDWIEPNIPSLLTTLDQQPVEVVVAASSRPTWLAEEAPSNTKDQALTVPQFLAQTFRQNVLKSEEATADPLTAEDAVAMVDRTLAPEGRRTVGIAFESKERGRFSLKLGENFSVSRH